MFEFKMDTLHQKSLKSAQIILPCTAQILRFGKRMTFSVLQGAAWSLLPIQFEEGEEEWSSDTNSLLVLLRNLIMELRNKSVA